VWVPCLEGGTRSTPWAPKGRHRARRRSAIDVPRQAPWVSTASTAYSLHEG